MTDYGVTSAGYVLKPYQISKDELKERMRQLFGIDILVADTSDLGRFCGLQAERCYTLDQKIEAVSALLDRERAPGIFLDGLLGILAISRGAATYSSALVTIVGAPGTTIQDGVHYITNSDNIKFYAAQTIVIPAGGSVDVTFEAESAGPVSASAGTLTTITNLPAGVTSATNASAAELGADADTDAIYRIRGRQRIAAAGRSHLDAFYASLFDASKVSGLTDARIVINSTDADDADGRPRNSIEVVTIGGNAVQIANVIFRHAPVGIERVSTALSYAINVPDSQGVGHSIVAGYGRQLAMYVDITITTDSQWDAVNLETQVKTAIVDYLAGIGLGDEINDLDCRVSIDAVTGVNSIMVLQYYVFGDAPASGDYDVGLVEYARGSAGRVNLTVT